MQLFYPEHSTFYLTPIFETHVGIVHVKTVRMGREEHTPSWVSPLAGNH